MNAPQPAPRLKLLLIDDDPDVRKVLGLALGTRHEVAEAENGLFGLTLLDQFEPDFVITDVLMPIMSGIEMIEEIRKHPRFFNIPVFFISAERHQELPGIAKEVGANLFLPKPIDPAKLLKLIDYFVQELKITPGSGPSQRFDTPAGGTPRPKPGGTTLIPVRILTIDNNPEHVTLIRQVFRPDPKNRWEMLLSEEPRSALGNLDRLEPDVILYNPRQNVMQFAGFIQFLRQRKLLSRYQWALVGRNFQPNEIEFSTVEFGRDVIRLEEPKEGYVNRFVELFKSAAPKVKPKRMTLEEIKHQEKQLEYHLQGARDLQKERANLRDKYERLQKRIDEECK